MSAAMQLGTIDLAPDVIRLLRLATVLLPVAVADRTGPSDAHLERMEKLARDARTIIEGLGAHQPSFQGQPRAELARRHADEVTSRELLRELLDDIDAMTASASQMPSRVAHAVAGIRDVFQLLEARAARVLDALEYEADSQDAEMAIREPSDAILWDDAKKLLDLT